MTGEEVAVIHPEIQRGGEWQGHIALGNEVVHWDARGPSAGSAAVWRWEARLPLRSYQPAVQTELLIALGPPFPNNLGTELWFYITSDIVKIKILDNVPDPTHHDSLRRSVIGVGEQETAEWVSARECDFLRTNEHGKGERSSKIQLQYCHQKNKLKFTLSNICDWATAKRLANNFSSKQK